MNKRKGQTLIHNMVENWMLETGEIPNGDSIVSHLLSMEDSEFDSYMGNKPFIQRLELQEEVIQKEKEREEKHPKTKNFYTKKQNWP